MEKLARSAAIFGALWHLTMKLHMLRAVSANDMLEAMESIPVAIFQHSRRGDEGKRKSKIRVKRPKKKTGSSKELMDSIMSSEIVAKDMLFHSHSRGTVLGLVPQYAS